MKDQLERIRKLIEKPDNWTQGEPARDKNGNLTSVFSAEAVCWCLAGATMKALHIYDLWDAALLIAPVLDVNSLTVFNDTSTHQQVLERLDAAIAKL